MNNIFSSEAEVFTSEASSINNFNLPDADLVLHNGLFDNASSNLFYNTLLKEIAWKQEVVKFYGKAHLQPRLTAWYGENNKSYSYAGISMNPAPWTEDLLKIKEEIEKIANINFTSVLLNLYRKGNDSVSWHSDNEKGLVVNPVIGSVSFGESRVFQLRHKHLKNVKKNILLTQGSFLLMKGSTQSHWQHQVSKSSKTLRPRISLTFRVMT